MLTDYLVRCPHHRCHWFGSLPSNPDADAWRGSASGVLIVVFQCPRCQQEWQARIVGDDVEALPPDERDDDSDPLTWPPLELGVGD